MNNGQVVSLVDFIAKRAEELVAALMAFDDVDPDQLDAVMGDPQLAGIVLSRMERAAMAFDDADCSEFLAFARRSGE